MNRFVVRAFAVLTAALAAFGCDTADGDRDVGPGDVPDDGGGDAPGDARDEGGVAYTIGGSVTGLTGSGLVLQNNGGDDLAVVADGAFTFAAALPDGGAYEVTVRTQPTGPAQTCTVAGGSGTVTGANVASVAVSCGGCGPDLPAPEEVLGAGPDPTGGSFGLDEALDGLPAGDGPLRAILRTEHGEITCTLEPTLVPNGVANFVGLARGRRPWLDPATRVWVKRRFYDGLLFHRIIDDFMIQGGDPLGTGRGGPGYSFDDEIGSLRHQPGTLAYANSGPDTNGSQFYITEVATAWLDGSYTIFGSCEPLSVIRTLAAVPTNSSDRPLTDVRILAVEITRCPPPGP